MDIRIELMGHMVVGILVYTGHIYLTQSEMSACWTFRIGEVIDTCTIQVLALTGIMVVIAIILIGEVIGDIFHMSL